MKLANGIMYLLMLEDLDVEESSLSRLFKHMDKNDIGIISASRDQDDNGNPLSYKDNQKRTEQLLKELRNRGYGPTKLRGHFEEEDPTDKKKKIKVKETAFFVVGKDGRDLLKDLKTLGKKFDQDSILHKAKGKKAVVAGTRAGIKDFTVGNFNVPKLGQEFDALSKIGGRTFIFKEARQTGGLNIATSRIRKHQIRTIEKGIEDGKSDDEIIDTLYTAEISKNYPETIERSRTKITEIRELMALNDEEQLELALY